ncbi:MAG: OmpA family protein [Pseudomonadota bacterium]
MADFAFVQIDKTYSKDGYLKARLYNFGIKSHTLPQAHVAFLVKRVRPLLVNHDSVVWLRGMASSTGKAADNQKLSQRRADAVATELILQRVEPDKIVSDAVGEEFSTITVPEDAWDRAVDLIVQPGVLPKRTKPPKKVPPKPKTPPTYTVKIKMIREYSVGFGGAFGVGIICFLIWDPKLSLASYYTVQYGGLSIGVLPIPLEITGEGPWNDLTMSGRLQVNEFACSVTMQSVGGLHVSMNRLTMLALPRGITTVPQPTKIDTGVTLGASIAGREGTMRLMRLTSKRGLWRYTGGQGISALAD